MTDKVINYYVSGNTAKGYTSLLDTNIDGLKVILLKGNYQKLKSDLLRMVSKKWLESNHKVEILHSPSNSEYIEGVINRDINVAVIGINNVDEEKVDTVINVDATLDIIILKQNIEQILELEDKISISYKCAITHFEKALKIHDDWEEIYISNMNKEKADQYSKEIINHLIKDKKLDKKSIVRHRFFGAATPIGPIDFVENLTNTISKRYFIKGRPGTGKSTMLKRLVNKASENGFDVEVYHCGFDPDSLDMVLIRELDIVIFDSTAPHEYFPDRVNDEIIDMYKKIIAYKTDENYKVELEKFNNKYKLEVKEATIYLEKVKLLNDRIEEIYQEALISKKLDFIKQNLNAIT